MSRRIGLVPSPLRRGEYDTTPQGDPLNRKKTIPTRHAAALLVLAVLAGCNPGTEPPAATGNPSRVAMLSEPEAAGALPPVPPLWRIDPAMDESGHLLDVVPDDLEHGIPPSLRGLRPSVLADQTLQEDDNYQWLSGSSPPALSRDDFRKGSCRCVEYMAGGVR